MPNTKLSGDLSTPVAPQFIDGKIEDTAEFKIEASVVNSKTAFIPSFEV
jgi:hypothetical protein